MAYTYELPNMTGGGFDSTIIGISSAVPQFIPLLLFFTYLLVLLGGMLAQKNRVGSADMPLWSTIASLGTLMIALPMTTVAGVIEPVYLVILVLITVMSGVWLFLNQNRNEV